MAHTYVPSAEELKTLWIYEYRQKRIDQTQQFDTHSMIQYDEDLLPYQEQIE